VGGGGGARFWPATPAGQNRYSTSEDHSMGLDTAATAAERQKALLEGLDGLCGCTRVAEIRYRIEWAEQHAAALRKHDYPLGRRQRGQTRYGDEIARYEQQAADWRATLDAAHERDQLDQDAHLAASMLEQALDELLEAVQAGTLSPSEALAPAQQARQQYDDPITRADWLQGVLDAR